MFLKAILRSYLASLDHKKKTVTGKADSSAHFVLFLNGPVKSRVEAALETFQGQHSGINKAVLI